MGAPRGTRRHRDERELRGITTILGTSRRRVVVHAVKAASEGCRREAIGIAKLWPPWFSDVRRQARSKRREGQNEQVNGSFFGW